MSDTTHAEAPLSTTAERQAVTSQAGVTPSRDWVIVTRGIKREYDMGGEIVRAHRRQAPAIAADRRAHRVADEGFGHSSISSTGPPSVRL